MSRVSLIAAAMAWTGPIAVLLAQGAFAQSSALADVERIATPVIHENLGFYFIRGVSTAGPVPLTLAEALGGGGFTVHETGSVNQLAVENTSSESVFIQAGDIVKGGQQDRVLTVSLLIPPKSGRMPIGAFCVEQGRWAVRGKEDVKRFASSEKSVPSREAKLAMLAPVKQSAEAPTAAVAGVQSNRQNGIRQSRSAAQTETGTRQAEIWANVGKIQSKLSANLNAPVASGLSTSSLQLSLENDKLATARAAYSKALLGAVDGKMDIVGVVVAINGRLSSAEIYPSNGLFTKMWPKLFDSSATEAIADKQVLKVEAMPTIAQVTAFLDAADAGKVVENTQLDTENARQLRDSPAILAVATKRADGTLVHRSYLAK